MNFEKDFTEEQQELLKQASIISENRNYTKEEISQTLNSVIEYAMSKSSKEQSISKELKKFDSVINILSKNEKI